MRGVFGLVVAAAASLIGQSLAIPIVVDPGTVEDIIITEDNTINGTHVPKNGSQMGEGTMSAFGTRNLKFQLHNNFGGGQLNAYVTGKDPSGAVVMLTTDGTFFHPDPAGSQVPVKVNSNIAIPLNPQGQITEFVLPDYISAGRVWIANGELQFFTVATPIGVSLVEPSAVNPEDPSAAINWGFVELTNIENGGIYANISFVDFVGLVMGMALTPGSGEKQIVKGLRGDAVPNICNEMRAQSAKDGQPWDKMCVTDQAGNPLRILAPNIYKALYPDAQNNYYTSYVDQVWDKYRNQDLVIDTQAGPGKVACRVNGDQLNCAGDNRGYPKPTVGDIWGCNSGPFAIQGGDNAVHYAVVPRLCAAFHRTTLLLDGGDVQPSLGRESYYTNDPTSHYSRIVHEYEIDGKGYAFSYDDVNPDGQNEAGLVSDPNPQLLEIFVGGFE